MLCQCQLLLFDCLNILSSFQQMSSNCYWEKKNFFAVHGTNFDLFLQLKMLLVICFSMSACLAHSFKFSVVGKKYKRLDTQCRFFLKKLMLFSWTWYSYCFWLLFWAFSTVQVHKTQHVSEMESISEMPHFNKFRL